MGIKNINDKYHSNSKLQKRVINEDNFTYRNLLPVIDKYLRRRLKIVDLGCGVGTLDFYCASKGCQITGVDDSRVAINVARKNAKNLGFNEKIKFVSAKIPFILTNRMYDMVLMTEIIEHTKDDKKVIRFANKLLKKGGVVIISTRAIQAPLFKLGLARFHDKRVGHVRRYSMDILKSLVSYCGFDIEIVKNSEGLVSDFLFSFPGFGNQIVRIANKLSIISKLLGILDIISLNMFGASQLIVVARKI